MDAAERLFSNPEHLHTDLHPQCRFPGRYQRLKEIRPVSFTDSTCPSFDGWLRKLDPVGVSLVYAGNYPDNPASVFGHTFLVIHSKDNQDLRNYAINYSAMVDEEIGLLFGLKGLLGAYYGFFSMDPYYVKVNEYNEGEGRDIWEYRLSLGREDTIFLLSHLWEMQYQTYFRYFFLDDNCSYFMLALLDATKPEWNLTGGSPLYSLPLETVKDVKEIPGAIVSTRFRASIRKRSEESFRRLSLAQRKSVKRALNDEKSVSSTTDPDVLDTALLSLYSKQSRDDGKLSEKESGILKTALLKRATLPVRNEGSIETPGDPTGIHGVRQITLGAGRRKENFALLGFRPSLHDQTDYPRGLLSFSELEVLSTFLRLEEGQVSLHSLDLFNLGLLRPWTLEEKKISWRTRWGYQDRLGLYCPDCRSGYGEGVGGLALAPADELVMSFLGGVFVNPFSFQDVAVGNLLEFGMIRTWGEKGRIVVEQKNYLNYFPDKAGSWAQLVKASGTLHLHANQDLNLIFTKGFARVPSGFSLGWDLRF